MESCRFCNPLGDGDHQFIKKFACGNLYLNKSQHYYGYLVYIYIINTLRIFQKLMRQIYYKFIKICYI